MAEEFQAEVCGGTWWTSPITTFNGSPFMGNCWQPDYVNMKARSTDESSGSCATTIAPESAFQVTDSSPSTATNWNQALLVNGSTTEESYNQTLSEILNSQEQPANFMTSSGDCNGNLVSTSYAYPSSLLQNLFDCSSPPQQPLYDFQANPSLDDHIPELKPKEQFAGGLHLANKAPFWNASPLDLNHNRAGFFASSQTRFPSSMYEEKPICQNIKSQNREIRDMGSSVKKNSGETTFKRPRLDTPSPLPTFKVRKEKLGDRVTALQQLVSPFGKTDTASVLHEAIEYIKHLHDQVNFLSTPYMKNGATMQGQHVNDGMKDNRDGDIREDLRSRGLCLVPVSSTFPVTIETTPDYWASSTFGSRFQ